MSKTGIFYSFHTNKTSKVSEKIIESYGKDDLEVVNAEDVNEESFLKFDNYIIGVATWWDGELPNYWDEFLPALEDLDLKGKKFAIYGLGDQKGYPENFNDGVGLFAKIIEEQGGTIVGYTSAEGYNFEESAAFKDGQFCGLCIDQENQARLTKKRVENWVKQIKEEFK